MNRKIYLIITIIGMGVIFTSCKGHETDPDRIEHDVEEEEEGPEVFFFDDFKNNSEGWMTGDSPDEYHLEIEDGYYHFDHFSSYGGWEVYMPVGVDESRDYEISCGIKKISGSQRDGFGLMIGWGDTEDSYAFVINAIGQYAFERWEGGEHTYLIEWTESEEIVKGNDATNELSVQKDGDTMILLINDVGVNEIEYPEFFGDYFGFTLYDHQYIAIDYLQFTYL